ncbi:hypothetical protein [Salinifilum ghardaiensis]
MGWTPVTGYAPATAHEGVAHTVLADGTLTATYTAPDHRAYRGWRAGCSCGWTGSDYPREQWGEGRIMPPDRVETAAQDEWQQHLHAAVPELAVHNLAERLADTRVELDAAVAAARAAGASWTAIGAAAGLSRQAAHERWGT